MGNVLHLPQVPEEWVNNYVGVPFLDRGNSMEGSDCWGLMEMVLHEQFEVTLPEYERFEYGDGSERKRISDYMMQMANEYPWKKIDVEEAKAGDVLLLRMSGFKTHVSVVVARGWMLHTEEGIDSVLERYDGTSWKNRVVGTYRHAQLITK